ncbi:MAG: hypothetical protein JOZ99_03555 [Actinobacteria bacterium]|nr:hypothetical protein [Actinomycetota bacterium]
MPDKIDELVERVRRIEERLAALVEHLPEPEAPADQTVAEGSIDLTTIHVTSEQTAPQNSEASG